VREIDESDKIRITTTTVVMMIGARGRRIRLWDKNIGSRLA